MNETKTLARFLAETREKVTATPDASLDKAAAQLRMVLKEGRSLDRDVPHAIGSLEKPMSDRDLEAKFRELAAGRCDADALIRDVWSLDTLDDAAMLVNKLRSS